MKHCWAGSIISNRQVPMDRVPDVKITRSLDAKGRVQMRGRRRIRKKKKEEGSSDEEGLLELGRLSMGSRKKTTIKKNMYSIC